MGIAKPLWNKGSSLGFPSYKEITTTSKLA